MTKSVAQLKKDKLRSQGKTGAIADMTQGENKYWRTLASDQSRPLQEVKKTYLRGLGYTGTLADMEKAFWT